MQTTTFRIISEKCFKYFCTDAQLSHSSFIYLFFEQYILSCYQICFQYFTRGLNFFNSFLNVTFGTLTSKMLSCFFFRSHSFEKFSLSVSFPQLSIFNFCEAMEGIKYLSEKKNGLLILDFTGIFMASQKTVGKDIDRSHPLTPF